MTHIVYVGSVANFGNPGLFNYYSAVVLLHIDYCAFGMNMSGRSYSSASYRYGFNGKEKDQEGLGGGGSTYDYGFRIYNPQIARFLSVDPLFRSYPWLTPYQFAENDPIKYIDLDGLEKSENQTNEGLSLIWLWGQKRVIIGTGIIHSTAHNTYNGGISLDNKEGVKYNFGVKLDKYSILLKHNKEDGFEAPEFEIDQETPDFLKNPMQTSKEDSETFSKTFGLTELDTKPPNVREMLANFQEALLC